MEEGEKVGRCACVWRVEGRVEKRGDQHPVRRVLWVRLLQQRGETRENLCIRTAPRRRHRARRRDKRQLRLRRQGQRFCKVELVAEWRLLLVASCCIRCAVG